MQYGNKKISCQQILTLHIRSRDLSNKGTGTRLVFRYKDTALRKGRYFVSRRNQLPSFAAAVLTFQRAAAALNGRLALALDESKVRR
jgi:hypothetical protein